MCKLLFKKLSEVVLNYLTDLIRVWCICEKEVISITTEPVYEDPLRKINIKKKTWTIIGQVVT